jgi:hypothetical protein
MSVVASATLEKYSSGLCSSSGLSANLNGESSYDSKVSAYCLGTVKVEGPAIEEPGNGGSSYSICSGCWGSEILQYPVLCVYGSI